MVEAAKMFYTESPRQTFYSSSAQWDEGGSSKTNNLSIAAISVYNNVSVNIS